jgi:hypothetical protein
VSLNLSNKQIRYLVEMLWSDDTESSHHTTWPSAVSYGGDSYLALPTMEIKLPANKGTLDEGMFEITFPQNKNANLDAMFQGNPFSPVYCNIYMQAIPNTNDPLKTTEVTITHVVGYNLRLATPTKNPQRRGGLVKLEFVSPKNMLQTALGWPANFQCNWVLFGRGCDLTAVEETVQLDAIDANDPKKVTLTGHTHPMVAPGGTPGKFWHRGYIEKDGIRIGIRDWDPADQTTFFLVKKPPSAWVGVGPSIRLVAGCDKTLETCRARWDNEARFMGFGYKMPDYHPSHEVS